MTSPEEFNALERLGAEFKGLPLGVTISQRDISTQSWNLLRGETSTPVAVLRNRALTGNIETMRDFCLVAGVSLAPHAKTALSPELVARQHHAGAWGFTAAIPYHVQLLWTFGVKRVLLANELVDPAALNWIAAELAAHPERKFFCYVDSRAGIDAAERAMADAGGAEPLSVLIELGHPSGRTGARSVSAAEELARLVVAAPHLRLAGVAGYEGTIASTRTPSTLASIDNFLADLGLLAQTLNDHSLFDHSEELIISAGGSLFFDRVVAVLAPLRSQFRIVLRSGCYVTHDAGLYAEASRAVAGLPTFEPALEVWTRVVSRPEPGLALLNAGRRDVSHDSGLPVPLAAFTSAGLCVDVSGATIANLSDQHAFMDIDPLSALAVGDLVGLGISHPCTTLDRWRLLLLVDDKLNVVGSIRTYF